MTFPQYVCPVCSKVLVLSENAFRCENGHCFDIARKGYVNLLTTKGRNPKNAGDNSLMVKSRSDFLDKGYYSRLAEFVAQVFSEYEFESNAFVIDSGCGEGYYTYNYALKNPKICFVGIDISKNAIEHACTRKNTAKLDNLSFAVGSSFSLPFCDKSADAVISTFAPVTDKEYARVLKDGGKLIVVSPDKLHLFGLKRVLYDMPYENKPNAYGLTSFELVSEKKLKYDIELQTNADILNLFAMTPYYYKTSVEAKSRLDSIERLSTSCEFVIQTYQLSI